MAVARRVVLATTPGIVGITSIEDCLERFDGAMNTDELLVLNDAFAGVVYECAQIGLELGTLAEALT